MIINAFDIPTHYNMFELVNPCLSLHDCSIYANLIVCIIILVSVDLIPLLSQTDVEKLGVTHVGECVMLSNLAKAHQSM